MKIDELNNELAIIKEQKEYVIQQLKKYSELKECFLVVRKSDRWFQYYFRRNNGDMEYIAAKDKGFAARLAQRDYYEKMLKEIQNQEKAISIFTKKYNVLFRNNLYEGLSDGRKKLIKPIVMPDDEYVSKWKEKYTGGENTIECSMPYATNNGELVRSKSEKILADLFDKYGIVYCYEPRIILYNGQHFYPDFALLNLRERKTYYWEHFGLTSDAAYSKKNLEKLAKYEKSGIIIGENLLVSTEAEGINLDVLLIEKKIKAHLL